MGGTKRMVWERDDGWRQRRDKVGETNKIGWEVEADSVEEETKKR